MKKHEHQISHSTTTRVPTASFASNQSISSLFEDSCYEPYEYHNSKMVEQVALIQNSPHLKKYNIANIILGTG